MADILDSIGEIDDDLDMDPTEEQAIALEEVAEDDDGVMSEAKAREVTDAIRSAAKATHILVAHAHAGKAYRALGYKTWKEYVTAELEMSAQRSYQLLDLSRITAAIDEATPDGVEVKLTEAEARDLKNELPRITAQLREETADLDADEAEVRANELIREAREQKKLEDKAIKLKEKSVDEAREEGVQKGLEMAADSLLETNGFSQDGEPIEERGGLIDVEVAGDGSGGQSYSPMEAMNLSNFFGMISTVKSLPEPEEIVKLISEDQRDTVDEQISQVAGWINRFVNLWEN